MTERSWTEETILASDVWGVEKSIAAMSDEELLAAWEQAVSVSGVLGKLAERLKNDPLLLALTDALVRAEEELARVEDRLARLGGTRLHPREEKRLRGLMRRSDALGSARMALAPEEWGDRDFQAATLAILEGLQEEANEQFRSYRQEVGIFGRTS